MFNAASLTKALVICLGTLFIHTSASSQLLTLDECINVYAKDTSYVRQAGLNKYFTIDTTVGSSGMYTRILRNKTNNDISLIKSVTEDTLINLDMLIYSFENIEQFTSLKNRLQSQNFTLVDYLPAMFTGATYTYTNNEIQVGLIKSASDTIDVTKKAKGETRTYMYGLVIQKHGKKIDPYNYPQYKSATQQKHYSTTNVRPIKTKKGGKKPLFLRT